MALQHWGTNFIFSRSVFKYSFCIFLNSWYCSSITLSPIWQGWNVISLWFCKLILNEKIIGLMLKLKLQYFGYLMQRADSLEKTLILGKIEKRRGQQRMTWLDNITDSMDMSLSKLHEIVKDRGAWHAAVHGITKNWTWLSDWTIILLVKIVFESEGLSTLEGGKWQAYRIWFRLPSPYPVWVPWDPAPGV